MSTSTVSSKGQIVIPSAVRADMAVQTGTRVERSRDDIAAVVEALLQTSGLVVQMPDLVWQALRGLASSRADFVDHRIERSSAAVGCTSTVTFEKTAARDAGMRLMSAAVS